MHATKSAFMTGLRSGPWKGGAVVAGVALVAGLVTAPQAQAAPPRGACCGGDVGGQLHLR